MFGNGLMASPPGVPQWLRYRPSHNDDPFSVPGEMIESPTIRRIPIEMLLQAAPWKRKGLNDIDAILVSNKWSPCGGASAGAKD